jgi:hypothetical protein
MNAGLMYELGIKHCVAQISTLQKMVIGGIPISSSLLYYLLTMVLIENCY